MLDGMELGNMAEYIDREALLEKLTNSSETWAKNIENIRNWWPHAVKIRDNIVTVIMETPVADVEEVVRCKDCTYSTIQNGCDSLYCYSLDIAMGENDFCSYGERRKENV